MYKKILVFIIFCVGLTHMMHAQNDQKVIYNLNDCIRIAIENNSGQIGASQLVISANS